jgi:hypothetical protein
MSRIIEKWFSASKIRRGENLQAACAVRVNIEK